MAGGQPVTMSELLIAVLVVLVVSASCSMTEAALFSSNLVRIRQRAESGSGSARRLLRIRESMARPISAIVVLNNIANIGGSILIGDMAARTFGNEWIGVFSAVLTLAVIMFGEIVPKTLGERYADSIALTMAQAVWVITLVLTPLLWFIETALRPVTGGNRGPTTTEAEIQLLTRIGHQEGIIEEDEREMIERVFRLNDTTAQDIMTPRVSLTTVPGQGTLEDIRDAVLASQHSRILAIGDSVDDVLGIVLRGDVLAALLRGRGGEPVTALVRPAPVVVGTARADRLLEVFRKERMLLAVVIDEYGGVMGVVTLEDVLEVVMGEIVDETDRVTDLQADARRRGRVRRKG